MTEFVCLEGAEAQGNFEGFPHALINPTAWDVISNYGLILCMWPKYIHPTCRRHLLHRAHPHSGSIRLGRVPNVPDVGVHPGFTDSGMARCLQGVMLLVWVAGTWRGTVSGVA